MVTTVPVTFGCRRVIYGSLKTTTTVTPTTAFAVVEAATTVATTKTVETNICCLYDRSLIGRGGSGFGATTIVDVHIPNG